ncbi:MAG: NAD(P)/FAD-dependent oxidoreductase [Geminicoccaceae bacterium]|nr:NAD(P)/FAD-dependent oxidoreductase [Geminicoccaceae bacterium]
MTSRAAGVAAASSGFDGTDRSSPAGGASCNEPPRVVIVGAGFAGLAAARALAGAKVAVTLIDRHNYHLFVPMLYQVATAGLSPADIAEPIRRILRRARNVEVLLGEVDGVDVAEKLVRLADGHEVAYDTLILATGSRQSHFGHPEWEPLAPGLRTIDDAREIRSRVLLAFERAEACDDPKERRRLMTIVVVGGGPTGVELAGSVAELARHTLSRDFRHIEPASARVLLVEAGGRVLAGFPESLSRYAARALERLGVEVRVDAPVEAVRQGGVTVGGRDVPAATVLWGAGVAASPAGRWLGVGTDRVGRVPVGATLAVPGLEGVYVLGDTALAKDGNGRPLPGLAQVAKQQGRHLGNGLRRHLEDGSPIRPFRFRDMGNMATIGRHAAVADFGWLRLKGRPAWFLWGIVHVFLLVGFGNRLAVTGRWLWSWATYARGARLITRNPNPSPAE